MLERRDVGSHPNHQLRSLAIRAVLCMTIFALILGVVLVRNIKRPAFDVLSASQQQQTIDHNKAKIQELQVQYEGIERDNAELNRKVTALMKDQLDDQQKVKK